MTSLAIRSLNSVSFNIDFRGRTHWFSTNIISTLCVDHILLQTEREQLLELHTGGSVQIIEGAN